MNEVWKENFNFSTVPVCNVCGKVFTLMKNLNQHLSNMHEKGTSYNCTDCPYNTPLKSDLKCRMKRHANTPTALNPPPKVTRFQPNIIYPPDDSPNQFLHECVIESEERDEINRCFQQSDQIGWGVSQILDISDDNCAVNDPILSI